MSQRKERRKVEIRWFSARKQKKALQEEEMF